MRPYLIEPPRLNLALIRDRIDHEGIIHADLAEECGCTRQTLWRYLTGRRRMDARTLKTILDATGLDWNDVWGR